VCDKKLSDVEVEIVTHDVGLLGDLFGPGTKTGMQREVESGVNVTLYSSHLHGAIDPAIILELSVSIAEDAAIAPAASWLYDKLKGHNAKILIERTEVEIEEGQIRRVLMEKFERRD
jgi:hypothetical protein